MSHHQETDPALAKLRSMTYAELEALVPDNLSKSSRPFLDPYQDRNLQIGLAAIRQSVLPTIHETVSHKPTKSLSNIYINITYKFNNLLFGIRTLSKQFKDDKRTLLVMGFIFVAIALVSCLARITDEFTAIIDTFKNLIVQTTPTVKINIATGFYGFVLLAFIFLVLRYVSRLK